MLFEKCDLDTSYCSKNIENVSHSESLDDLPKKKSIGNDVDEDSESASVDDDEAKKKRKASA